MLVFAYLAVLASPFLEPASAFHIPTIFSTTTSRHDLALHTYIEKESVRPVTARRDDQQEVPTTTEASASFQCNFCKSSFVSRNAVFRHLRTDGCSLENPRSPGDGSDVIVKQSIAISFGYVDGFGSGDHDKEIENIQKSLPLNEWAGQQVFQAVETAIDNYNQQNTATAEEDDDAALQQQHQQIPLDFRLQSSRTQSSVARLRSRILQQEPDCSAAGDVLLVTGTCLESSVNKLEDALSGLPFTGENNRNQHGLPPSVRIWSCKLLMEDVTLHAERSCTQMVYHYLLPLSWLPDADLLKTQWKGWKEAPPTDSLRRFKAALRNTESSMVLRNEPLDDGSNRQSANEARRRPRKIAAGRFGRLGAKERRAWHNFADPTLQGDASPNQEPVWRVVDACRMIGIVNFGKQDASLVVELKGDAFCPQQCRRIIGTALAITHGWIQPVNDDDGTKKQQHDALWDDFLLNHGCILETIPAPAHRLYLADTRFHFEESGTSGKPFFESDIGGKVIGVFDSTKAVKWTQQQLLQSRCTAQVEKTEMEWLGQVQLEIAPRIQESLLQLATTFQPSSAHHANLSPTPPVYEIVLEKLRDIVKSQLWPDTSVARSSVIRKSKGGNNDGVVSGGSFTVINIKLLNKISAKHDSVTLPLGNQYFPDVATAVFELEEQISHYARKVEADVSTGRVKLATDLTARRPQSTHCAINFNAQFTPHVDSGRGAGQSLSTIVGLGDYKKGELYVEGLPCDIRYTPLEFNGWKLRHWTNQYEGERFSLVWFTPEIK